MSHQGILGKFRKWGVCMCMHECACLYTIIMYVCASVHVCLCVCVCTYLCMHVQECMHECVYVHVCIDGVLMSVWTCVYNYVFTSVYAPLCIHVLACWFE